MNIKKNDIVKVMAGKDKGKTGKITQVFPKENKLVVEGVNIRVKHLKGRGDQKGQRLEFNAPMDASNVMFINPKTGQITRLGVKILPDGKKVRRMIKGNETLTD
ncbi:MAG: 50S ribosomal protein L24 [bacterium]